MATMLKVRKDGRLAREEKKEDFPLSQFLWMMAIGIFMLVFPIIPHLFK